VTDGVASVIVADGSTSHSMYNLNPVMAYSWSVMAHDGVVVSGGTTTVFDSLCVGESIKQPERSTMLAPLVAALEQGQKDNLFRADHLLHLRCEICDPDTMALTEALIKRLELEALARGAQLVTTEKDAVRLPRHFRTQVLTLVVRLQITDWSALDAKLARLFGPI
jgi:hypothetical protein